MHFITFLAIPLALFFIPAEAFAWGPVTHLSFGLEVLDKLPMLTPLLQELLTLYPFDYLYGCMAADITLKKDGVKYEHNCHNWDVGLQILKESKLPSQKAFAYGYLSHLAADTISHNYFVPYQTVATYPTHILRHIYWETRLDTLQDPKIWKLARRIAQLQHGSVHDQLLEGSLKKTLFSFRTNKIIFNSIMHSLPSYKILMRVFEKSSWDLHESDVREYQELCLMAIIDFLKFEKNSKIYLIDPSGKLALNKAKRLRQAFKRIHKRHPDQISPKKLRDVKRDFKEALFKKAFHQRWTVHQ